MVRNAIYTVMILFLLLHDMVLAIDDEKCMDCIQDGCWFCAKTVDGITTESCVCSKSQFEYGPKCSGNGSVFKTNVAFGCSPAGRKIIIALAILIPLVIIACCILCSCYYKHISTNRGKKNNQSQQKKKKTKEGNENLSQQQKEKAYSWDRKRITNKIVLSETHPNVNSKEEIDNQSQQQKKKANSWDRKKEFLDWIASENSSSEAKAHREALTRKMKGGGEGLSVEASAESSIVKDDQKQPLVGIRFSYIVDQFIPQNGGWEAFNQLTTTDVKEKFIMPTTKERKESYWDLLQRQGQEKEGRQGVCSNTASAFVSHAHGYKFLDTITALQNHFVSQKVQDDFYHSDEDDDGPPNGHMHLFHYTKMADIVDTGETSREDPYIFFDIFCINQHRTDWSYEFLSTTFMSSIEKFGRTVVVMSPWNDPTPFKRAWCIYEVYCNAVTNGKYEIALSKKEREKFLQDIMDGNTENEINQMLATINAEKSQAYYAVERDRIHSIIRQSVGFDKLNRIVFQQYQDWVLQTAVSEVKMAYRMTVAYIFGNDSKAKDYPKLLLAVGRLYEGQGKYAQAQKYLEESLKVSQQEFGEFSEFHLACMGALANLYRIRGNYDKAEPLFKLCLENDTKQLGEDHPDVAGSMNNLGTFYLQQGKFNDSEPLLVSCLAIWKAHLGEDHPHTLACMSNLAMVYDELGQYKKSESLLVSCLEMKRKSPNLGDNHPSTQTTMSNLAGCYVHQGLYDKAQPLYLFCLQKGKAQLGENHPENLPFIIGLANVYMRQRNLLKAKLNYKSGLEICMTHLGEHHPYTQEIMRKLETPSLFGI